MSRTLSGIHGVPFRKVEERRKEPGSRVWVETLSCGHKNLVIEKIRFISPMATKRRCYACPRKEK